MRATSQNILEALVPKVIAVKERFYNFTDCKTLYGL